MPLNDLKKKDFLQKKLRHNDLILEAAGEGICAIDSFGEISLANPAAAKMLARPLNELRGLNYREAFFGKSRFENDEEADLCPINFALKYGEASHVNVETFSRKNRSSFLVEYICVPIKEKEEIIGAVVTFQDITERRDIEIAIAEARDAALQAVQTKAAFLANMSHEIRTPLNAIIGMIDFLQNTNPNPEQIQYINALKQNSRHLLDIVNDILDFSKIEAKKLILEKHNFDLRQIVTETLELFRTEFERRNLSSKVVFDNDLTSKLFGDSGRLRQVFNNLLSNAVKFTKSGGISFEVLQISENDTEVLLKFIVSDTGIGISEEAQKILFQPFTQADASTSRQFGGTGLGLAICKQLVELMDGEIGFESRLHQGSRFWFTAVFQKLPLESSSSQFSNFTRQVSSANNSAFPVNHQAKILIAEDNEVNLQVALGYLRQLGFTAESAGNGLQVVDACQNNAYDLILMDCQMPEMDGYEATRQIRRQINANSPKIIAMTANVLDGEREKCLQSGMDDYLGKPLNKEDLAEILVKYLPNDIFPQKVLDSNPNIVQHSLREVLDEKVLQSFLEIESRGEKNFLRDTLNLYLSHTSLQLQEIKEDFRQRKLSLIKEKVHALKGSSGSVGFNKMYRFCLEMEKAGDFFSAQKVFENMEREFVKLKQIAGS